MIDRRASVSAGSPLDRGRAWLGIGAALALGLCAAAGAGGRSLGVIAIVVSVLQRLNLSLFRSDSASRKAGHPRYSPEPAGSGSASAPSEPAPLLFRLEEAASLATSLGALLLLTRGLDMPIHPLLYVAVGVIFVIGVLFQLLPQLRPRGGKAPKRVIARPPSQWLN